MLLSTNSHEVARSSVDRRLNETGRITPSVGRALLLINRKSGTGADLGVIEDLRAIFADSLAGGVRSTFQTVDEHAEARLLVSRYLREDETPAAVIVGGGGGTLRAAIEGICQGSEVGRLPGRERVRVAALRMGSGNVLARQFGAPRDARAGLRGILANIHKDCTARCAVMRCETGTADGGKLVQYAVTLAGFGQFGRVPGDLARWHRRLPRLHKGVAKLLGVERLTDIEYALALVVRSLSCTLWPGLAETVEVRSAGANQKMRLFAGLALNFPFKALPLDPGVRLEEEALSLHLIPQRLRTGALLIFAPRCLAQRAQRIKIDAGNHIELRLIDRDSAEYFLDEDPAVVYRSLTLRVMGSITFVPGPDYRFQIERKAL